MPEDLFSGALSSDADLRELYDPPIQRAVEKDVGRIDEAARSLIALSPLVIVASVNADGEVDVTPRGGQPGFVTVLDEGHLAVPDATGNRRLDTLTNIVETGRAGVIFLIPGRNQTLRVNGRACVTARADVLERLTPVGKPPRTAIVIAVEELFTHCPKAFVRSSLWDPETWIPAEEQPSEAEVRLAHSPDPDLTLEEVERQMAESLRTNLA
jgi:uncharacterized protein